MKKRLKWLLPIISAIVCAIGLFACGEAPATSPDCEHENLKHVEKIDSTCESTGTDEYWVCLDCDKMFADSTGAAEISEKPVISELKPHTLGEPTSAVAATCIRNGNIEYYTCSVCENHFTDAEAQNRVEDVTTSIDPAAHKYGELQAERASTCSVAGEAAHKDCEYCHMHFTEAGEELSDADLVLPIDPTAHKYGELKPANEPTCTENGYPANKECEYCHKHFTEAGEEITSATSALGHNYTSIVVKTQPTKTVYKVGEDFDAAGMVVTATCTRDNCGEEKTITDYTITGDKNLQKGAKSITVAWNDGKKDLTVQTEVAVYEDHDLSNAGSYADFVYAETGDLTATAVGAIAGTKATVICGQSTYEDGATLSDNAITLKAATVSGMLDGKKYGDFTVTFVTDSYDRYVMNIAIATMFIDSAEDLKAITAANTADTVDAYYIITADIDASGAGTVRIVNNDTASFEDGRGHINTEKGFKGIFDGRGHIISGVATAGGGYRTFGGLFGNLADGSVVRNVAFTDVTKPDHPAYDIYLFCGDGCIMNGTIENVLVTTTDNTLRVFPALTGGKINNFMAVGINAINQDSTSTTVSNIMTVAANREFGGFASSNPAYDAQPTYATINDMLAALSTDNTLASWSGSSISFKNGSIYFGDSAVVRPELVVQSSITGNEAARGTTVTFTTEYTTLALKTAIDGVTLTDNVLTVAGTVAENTEIVITATSTLDSSVTRDMLTYKVIRNYEAVAFGTYDFSLEGDSSSVETSITIDGSIERVVAGDNQTTEGVSYSNGMLTFSKSALQILLGDKKYADDLAIEIYTDADKKYTATVDIATMFIDSADDLTAITAANTADTVDAYYIITADIDASGAGTVRIVNNDTASFEDGRGHINTEKGFKGIFDGRGHIISGVATTGGVYRTFGGLFGNLAEGSVVRNVAFTDITTDSAYLFCGDGCGMYGTVKNVLISTTNNTLKVFASLTGGRISNFMAIGVQQINVDTGVTAVSNIMTVAKETEFGGFSWTGNAVYDAQPTYATVNDMIAALATDNKLAAWQNSLITYDNGAILFDGKEVVKAAA